MPDCCGSNSEQYKGLLRIQPGSANVTKALHAMLITGRPNCASAWASPCWTRMRRQPAVAPGAALAGSWLPPQARARALMPAPPRRRASEPVLVQGKDGRTDKLLTIHPGPAMTHLFDWQHACGAHIENTHSANGLAHSSHRAQLCGTYHSGLRVTPAVGEGADSVLSAALCGLQHTLASGACRCI